MVQILGKGEILKGSDCEIAVVFSTCKQHIDIGQAENFTCDIYTTPGGAAITRSLDGFEIDGEVGITLLQWEELDQLEDGVLRYTLNFDYEGEHIVREMSTMYYLKTPIDYTPVDFVDRQEMEDYVDGAVSGATSGSSPTVFLRVDANGSWIQQEEDGSDLKAFIEMAKTDPTKCCTVYISTYGQQFNGTVEYSQSVQITDVSGITHNGARIIILQPVAQSQTIRYTAIAYADENGIYWSGGRNVGNSWELVSLPGQGQQGLYVHVDVTDPDNPVVDGFGLSLKPVVDGYVEIDDSTPSIVSNIKTFISGVTGMLELREYCNIWCYRGGTLCNTVYIDEPILSNEGSSFVYMEAAFFPASWERRYLLKMYIDGGRYFISHSGPIRIHIECIKEGDYVTSAETQTMIDNSISEWAWVNRGIAFTVRGDGGLYPTLNEETIHMVYDAIVMGSEFAYFPVFIRPESGYTGNGTIEWARLIQPFTKDGVGNPVSAGIVVLSFIGPEGTGTAAEDYCDDLYRWRVKLTYFPNDSSWEVLNKEPLS